MSLLVVKSSYVIMPWNKRVQRGRRTTITSNVKNETIKWQRNVQHHSDKLLIEDITSKVKADDPYVDFNIYAKNLNNSEQVRMYSNVIRGNSHSFRGKVCHFYYTLGECIECNQ